MESGNDEEKKDLFENAYLYFHELGILNRMRGEEG